MNKKNRKIETTNSDLEHLRDFAHEIRTPLNAMLGYTHLLGEGLADDADPGELRRYNDIVSDSTKRLLRICERVLDDAIAGQHCIAIEKTDAREIVVSVVETFKQLAKERGISIKVEFPDKFPDVMTDPILVEQVLSNLISNAIKYSPKGGQIKLKGEVSTDNQAMIFLIRDTGSGIPASVMMQIRNREHVNLPRNSDNVGWGRGLKIAHDICDRLGASLHFEAAETGGTVVMFRLPLASTQ